MQQGISNFLPEPVSNPTGFWNRLNEERLNQSTLLVNMLNICHKIFDFSFAPKGFNPRARSLTSREHGNDSGGDRDAEKRL
jgi:hypothetical protein